ncbi:hypothetical protein GCK32_013462 [Trichostrongylus colubriformis]|uniref:Uncharacterized protein n=1 Tax=Trichostrongylus colubriformis TaxID=6319 RepID=A0AAN8FBZ2_TRICO
MIMFASLSQGVMMMCFFVLSLASNRLVAQIAYTAAAAFNGLNIVGSIKCAQVVARQHVHFVMVCVTIGGCAICFILPVAVALLCPNNSMDEWSRLFLGVGFFVLVCNIPFLFLASSEPAPWTKSAAFRAACSRTLMVPSVVSMEKCDSRIFPESSLRSETTDPEAPYRGSERSYGLMRRGESTDEEIPTVTKRPMT